MARLLLLLLLSFTLSAVNALLSDCNSNAHWPQLIPGSSSSRRLSSAPFSDGVSETVACVAFVSPDENSYEVHISSPSTVPVSVRLGIGEDEESALAAARVAPNSEKLLIRESSLQSLGREGSMVLSIRFEKQGPQLNPEGSEWELLFDARVDRLVGPLLIPQRAIDGLKWPVLSSLTALIAGLAYSCMYSSASREDGGHDKEA